MSRVNKYRDIHAHVLPQNEHLNGTWVYGYLADENYINSSELEGEFLVDKDTVGQYIGVKDKDKKEVYDGDILENEYGYKGVVKWECCGFIIDWGSWNASRDLYAWHSFVKVIRNVYENADLLKEVK